MQVQQAIDATGRPSYTDLLREVRQAGLFEPRVGYYAIKIAGTVAAIASGWVLFVLLGDSPLQLLTAGFLAFAFGQAGIVGHDAGHHQIARSRRVNTMIGCLHMNLAVGLSFGWWVQRHRRHHAYPNHLNRDPDLTNELVAFTTSQMRRRRGWRRRAGRYQARLFFPAMFLLQGLALHLSHTRQLFRSGRRGRVIELFLLAVHATFYLGTVFAVLSPWRALAFVLVHQGLFGTYLGSIIAPNHKGMAVFEDSDKDDFVSRQVLSSRNIRGGLLVEVVFGGLNYQIEHHLFPSMPIPHLRHARPIVWSFCQQHGLAYVEVSLIESYQQALAHLRAVGRLSTTRDLS